MKFKDPSKNIFKFQLFTHLQRNNQGKKGGGREGDKEKNKYKL